MADEHKTEQTGNTGQQTDTANGQVFTQDEVNRIVSERLARERAKFVDYDEVKKTAETLAAEKKQREEKELVEQNKWKELVEQREKELEALKPKAERYDAWQTAEAQRIEKELEGLSDTQKTIVNALPLEQRMAAISEFKASTDTRRPGVPAHKGGKGSNGAPTIEDVEEAAKTYGHGSATWREVYGKYRQAQGYK